MFERFTERARQVVVLAQESAREETTSYIGTEHILLGITKEEEGLGSRVLASLDVNEETVKEWLVTEREAYPVSEKAVERGTQTPLTSRAKHCLELALREAVSLGHNYIGTEHLLLGLIREHEGASARCLATLVGDGFGSKIRNEIISMLSGPGSPRDRPAHVADKEAQKQAQEAVVEGLRNSGGSIIEGLPALLETAITTRLEVVAGDTPEQDELFICFGGHRLFFNADVFQKDLVTARTNADNIRDLRK